MSRVIRKDSVRKVSQVSFGSMGGERRRKLEDRAEVIFPTAAELEGIRAHAYEDGFSSGRADAALKVSEDVDALARALEHAVKVIEAQRNDYFFAVQSVLKKSLEAVSNDDPKVLAKKIERALSYAPSGFDPVICLSQEDFDAVSELIGSDSTSGVLKLESSTSMRRGEFVIKYPGGDIRSTLRTHVEAIEEILKNIGE